MVGGIRGHMTRRTCPSRSRTVDRWKSISSSSSVMGSGGACRYVQSVHVVGAPDAGRRGAHGSWGSKSRAEMNNPESAEAQLAEEIGEHCGCLRTGVMKEKNAASALLQ